MWFWPILVVNLAVGTVCRQIVWISCFRTHALFFHVLGSSAVFQTGADGSTSHCICCRLIHGLSYLPISSYVEVRGLADVPCVLVERQWCVNRDAEVFDVILQNDRCTSHRHVGWHSLASELCDGHQTYIPLICRDWALASCVAAGCIYFEFKPQDPSTSGGCSFCRRRGISECHRHIDDILQRKQKYIAMRCSRKREK